MGTLPPRAIYFDSRITRIVGLVCVVTAAAGIVWLYARQPRTLSQLRGSMAAAVGAYSVDRASFDAGLAYFRQDQFEEARRAFARADPAQQDAVTQFYVAYSFYRQGWGRLGSDDALFAQGLAAVTRAEALAPGGHVQVEDPTLGARSSDELAVELGEGLRVGLNDFNPLRLFRSRR